MSDNPYAAPNTPVTLNPAPFSKEGNEQLAGRFTRLAAAIVDGILMMGVLLPIQFGTDYIGRARIGAVSVSEQLGMSALGLVVFLLFNGYLLHSRGQTIGKYLTKIQIVEEGTGRLLPFQRVYLFRYLWTLPFILLVLFIPGQTDDLIVNIVVLIDALLIFGVDRRCLHDYIAGSTVVLFSEDRPRV